LLLLASRIRLVQNPAGVRSRNDSDSSRLPKYIAMHNKKATATLTCSGSVAFAQQYGVEQAILDPTGVAMCRAANIMNNLHP
jgi:hypothetical protein